MTRLGTGISTQPLSMDQVTATADTLARAFVIDPAYQYLFADADKPVARLADFFAGNLRMHLSHRCTHVALDHLGQPLATVTLRPPGGIHVSTLTMVRRGLLPFLWHHGRESVRRLFWLKDTYDRLEAEAADHRPHRYLHMMAVAPDHQGQGIGGALLRQVLQDAEGALADVADVAGGAATHPTVLTTHLPRNLPFYQGAGFEIISERVLHPPRGTQYTVWSMRSMDDARVCSN